MRGTTLSHLGRSLNMKRLNIWKQYSTIIIWFLIGAFLGAATMFKGGFSYIMVEKTIMAAVIGALIGASIGACFHFYRNQK